MKKILTIIMITLLPLITYAQDWRGYKGFVDFYCGTSMSQGDAFTVSPNLDFSDVKNELTFGFNITGGYQVFPFLFAGVGFGGYSNMIHFSEHAVHGDYDYRDTDHAFYSVYFPVFADFRWTLNINSVVTPFVDLKLGYQFGLTVSDGYMDSYYNWDGHYSGYEIDVRHRPGMYIQPSIGVRFGKRTAFNLGIAYNPSVGKEFVMIHGADESRHAVETVVGKSTSGSMMLTLGIDF